MTATAVQGAFDELGTPLRDTTFVVVDLETTGGSPATSAITEIGAVRVRGGVVEGEFQTLVDPGGPIPPFIAVLTGITDAMVVAAPKIEQVVPAFLEFARGAVLVAHNSPFDLGFLKAACARTGYEWPGFDHLDTVTLARRVLTRDEAPDVKLSTLSRVFRTSVTPCHRALADAQATTDVLHGLVERLGNLGVHSLEELRTFSSLVPPEQRRKRYLADHLPHRPGVYLFRDGNGRVLYVGKSKDLRARVRNYFVASEPRTRMAEMVACAERVDHVECSHGLEAEVRELRLIAEHKPRYNRRSRYPERALYLKLTTERFPRLAVVRKIADDGATYLGPFGSTRTAELARAAAHEAFRIRQCTMRITRRTRVPGCVLRELGRCGAPCAGEESEEAYAAHTTAFAHAVAADPEALRAAAQRRMDDLAAQHRYEDAAAHRDRLAAFVRAAARQQQLAALAALPLLVAAQPDTRGGWHLAVVKHGRLTAAGAVAVGVDPRPHVDALVATAETVTPGPGPTPCATSEEMQAVLRWLGTPGTRLVRVDGEWASPARGAARLLRLLDQAYDGAAPFADRRPMRTVAQPARRFA
ncbi:MAG TPA: DEDD exonuclease domain-containing protein [Mycobacteriales bacterium]|jgi:DNA polymerase-3 subunit epsilon|nr:DEDD exonuclease domain-containing protein [Mycobacteriales bacterium]